MKKVAAVIFDRVNALDVTGPLEALAAVRDVAGTPGYDIAIWSLDGSQVRAESGIVLGGEPLPATPDAFDVLIVPGGAGLREPHRSAMFCEWLRTHEHRFERIVSVCTGAYALAEAGFLDGRCATTHWSFAADFAGRFPEVAVEQDALFLRDGKFATAGGVASGMDLALAIIEEDLGAEVARSVARWLVVFLRRGGRERQFSAPLRMEYAARDRLRDIGSWIAANLDADLTVESLAHRANLSVRQFTRRFRDSFGVPPATYVARQRLERARRALEKGGVPLEKLRRETGYGSVDGFRRAFQRQFGISPREYRRRLVSGLAMREPLQ